MLPAVAAVYRTGGSLCDGGWRQDTIMAFGGGRPAAGLWPGPGPARGHGSGSAGRPAIAHAPAHRPPPPPPPPFVLTPQQQAEVDRLLDAWERRGNEVRTFECPFTRWDYDATFPPGKPTTDNPYGAKYVNHGTIIYPAPGQGVFQIRRLPHGKPYKRAARAMDLRRQVDLQLRLGQPACSRSTSCRRRSQGKAIVDGPLPFLFGAGAEKLKQRYYLRPHHAQRRAGRDLAGGLSAVSSGMRVIFSRPS